MKYTDEEKQKFRDLVAQGKPLKAAAAEAGISLAIGMKIRGEDNRKKRAESSPAPEEKPEEKEEENLTEGTVPPPGFGGGGAADGSGARGEDGARDALKDREGEESEEEKSEGEAGEEEGEGEKEEEKKNAVDPAEVLVNLSEMLCAGMVWIYARRKKVDLSAAQREELAWSPEERAELLRYGRQAAAALPGILIALGPYVGLLFYGYLLYMMTRSRCEAVSEFAPRRAGDNRGEGEEEGEIKDAEFVEKRPGQLNDLTEEW